MDMQQYGIEQIRDLRISVHEAELPESIHGFTIKKKDSDQAETYSIMLDKNMTEQEQLKSFLHECCHIWRRDHGKPGIDSIEAEVHAFMDDFEKCGYEMV